LKSVGCFLCVGKLVVTLSIQNEILSPVSSAIHETTASPKRAARRSDHELQLARRIDWRFLLPEPYLRRVAYFGPENGTLPAALKYFSESFQNISSAKDADFDLVALRLRGLSELAKAHKLLATGGFLYWEMPPINWSASLRGMKRSLRLLWAAVEADESGLATVPHKGAGLRQNSMQNRWHRILNIFRDHVAALERLGFDDIQIFWQRPSFEACLEIIPLNEAALDYAFSRPRSDLASQLKFAAGRVMMQTGLLAHLTPCFSLIARKYKSVKVKSDLRTTSHRI